MVRRDIDGDKRVHPLVLGLEKEQRRWKRKRCSCFSMFSLTLLGLASLLVVIFMLKMELFFGRIEARKVNITELIKAGEFGPCMKSCLSELVGRGGLSVEAFASSIQACNLGCESTKALQENLQEEFSPAQDDAIFRNYEQTGFAEAPIGCNFDGRERIEALGPFLWLSASDGTEIDSNGFVHSWKSVGSSNSAEFVPNSQTLKESQLPRLQSMEGSSCLKFVEFGCSLVSRKVQLRAPMTVYVVVLRNGGELMRMFGHFPNGGFLHDGQNPIFKSKHGFLGPKTNLKRLRKQGRVELLKFRVGPLKGVEIGTREAGFRVFGVSHDALFSLNQKLSVGGTNGGCESNVSIAEILVFDSTLSDSSDKVVVQALSENYFNRKTTVQLEDQLPIDCIHFDKKNSKDLFQWMPPLTNDVSDGKRREWESIVRKHLKKLSRLSGAEQLTSEAEVRWKLMQHRVRVFGEPCKLLQDNSFLLPPKHADEIFGMEERVEKFDNSEDLYIVKENFRSNCDFNGDVVAWKAPHTSSRMAKADWNSAVSTALRKIAGFQKGGNELKEFLMNIVLDLKATWSNLFGKLCPEFISRDSFP